MGSIGYGISQVIAFDTTVQAEFSAWVRMISDGEFRQVRFGIYMDRIAFGGNSNVFLAGGEGWVQVSGTGAIPAGTHTFSISTMFRDASSAPVGTEAHLDAIEIRVLSPTEAIPTSVCTEEPAMPEESM